VKRLFIIPILLLLFISCTAKDENPPQEQNSEAIILGFSQIGAESSWRNRNTESIKQAAEEQGIQLLFENAQQKQENQIKALRSFIVYQVDVIAFVPT